MSGIRGGGGVLVGAAALAVALILGLCLSIPIFVSIIGDDEPAVAASCTVTADGDAVIPNGWGDEVADAAEVAGVPVEVIAAQLARESGWNPDAVSSRGAAGLAQFMPGTWAQYGDGDPTDPIASIKAQGEYMKALMSLAGEHSDGGTDQVEKALAAYNWGDGNMNSVGWDWQQGPAETTNYVTNILSDAQVDFAEDCKMVTGPYAGELGPGEWTNPLPGGAMTSAGAFGGRNVAGLPPWANNHVGLDFATPDGGGQVVAPFDFRVTAVYAPDGCVLGKATEGPDFGIALCHMDRWSDADEFKRGDVVGEEGTRAGSVGTAVIPHLHMEMYRPGAPDPQFPGSGNPDVIDPTPLLVEKEAMP